MTTTTTGSRTIRRVNDFKVVKDTETYRQVSFEDEADPSAASLKRWQKRFRSNIRMETGRYIPLESIRVAHIPFNPTQLERVEHNYGDLSDGGSMTVTAAIPYAVSGGRVYLLRSTLAWLDSAQIQAFFEEELFPFMKESGLGTDEAKLVLVPNRQR